MLAWLQFDGFDEATSALPVNAYARVRRIAVDAEAAWEVVCTDLRDAFANLWCVADLRILPQITFEVVDHFTPSTELGERVGRKKVGRVGRRCQALCGLVFGERR